MISIKLFLAGILFALSVIPSLEGITELLLTWMKVFEARLSVQITKMNKQMQDIAYKEDEPKQRPIGFCAAIAKSKEIVEEEEEDYND